MRPHIAPYSDSCRSTGHPFLDGTARRGAPRPRSASSSDPTEPDRRRGAGRRSRSSAAIFRSTSSRRRREPRCSTGSCPREWNVRDAWIEAPDGRRLARFADSSLNLLGYSVPVDVTLSRDELLEHVFTDPEHPDRVPYRTSYWSERWGFCMTQREADSLPEGEYRAVIDATLEDGSLTYGEVRLDGSSSRTVLLTTTVCHPALANDNLSGIVVIAALARALAGAAVAPQLPAPVEPGHARSALLAPPQPRSRATTSCTASRSPASATGRTSPTSEAGAGRRRPTGRSRSCCATAPGRRSSTGRRTAATSASSAPPDSISRSARSRVPPQTRSPSTTSSDDDLCVVTPEALGGLVSHAPVDRRRLRARHDVRQRVAVRRAAARPSGPLPLGRRRIEPRGGVPVAAEPERREHEPRRHRAAVGAPFRGDRGCRGPARRARVTPGRSGGRRAGSPATSGHGC